MSGLQLSSERVFVKPKKIFEFLKQKELGTIHHDEVCGKFGVNCNELFTIRVLLKLGSFDLKLEISGTFFPALIFFML